MEGSWSFRRCQVRYAIFGPFGTSLVIDHCFLKDLNKYSETCWSFLLSIQSLPKRLCIYFRNCSENHCTEKQLKNHRGTFPWEKMALSSFLNASFISIVRSFLKDWYEERNLMNESNPIEERAVRISLDRSALQWHHCLPTQCYWSMLRLGTFPKNGLKQRDSPVNRNRLKAEKNLTKIKRVTTRKSCLTMKSALIILRRFPYGIFAWILFCEQKYLMIWTTFSQ